MRIQRGLLSPGDCWLVSATAPRQMPDPEQAMLIYEGTHTRIWRHPDCADLVTKLGLVKSMPRDLLRRYWSSQAGREWRATDIMQSLGFDTPELLGYAVPAAPCSGIDSLLYMKTLPENETLRIFLRRCDDNSTRRGILDVVANGVATIYSAGYHHKDCHWENVLRTQDGRLIWIDSDLRFTRNPSTQVDRLQSSLAQLAYTARDFISAAEWLHFAQVLEARFSGNDWGRALTRGAVDMFRDRYAGVAT